jgi:hypothetical protein
MAEGIAIVVILVAAFGSLIYAIIRPNPYSKMTDEEFEKETKKSTALGMAVLGAERILRRREADYITEEKLRHDKEAASVAGEPPEEKNERKGN